MDRRIHSRPRLTDHENDQLLELVRTGGDGARAQAEATLVEGNMALVHAVVNGLRWIRDEDRDDIEAEAAIGLLLAIRDFDPGLGIPFGAYSAYRVKWAARNSARCPAHVGRHCRQDHERPASLDAPLAEWEELTLGAMIAAPGNAYRAVIDREAIACHLRDLTPPQLEAVELLYGLGSREGQPPMTMREAAEVLGISHQAVAQRERKGLERMRARSGW